ncbi:MAG: hypothetical protein Q9181_002004 [Wetmoreana brouardii]
MYLNLAFLSLAAASFLCVCCASPVEDPEHTLNALYPRAPATFTHPGVLLNKAQLDFIKSKVAAGAQPWSNAYSAMLADPLASSTRQPSPFQTVACGSSSMNPGDGCHEEREDALAAYANALAWYISGTKSYATKAITYMNTWAKTIKDHTASNAPLQTGWSGASWARAAEIIRYSNAGWLTNDISAFETMLRNIYLPEIIGGSKSNGNWELVMMEAAQGIAVFLNDKSSYDKAMNIFASRAPAYVYLTTDGSCPKSAPINGFTTCSQVEDYWGQYSFPQNGIAQETCRDFVHTGYGISSMSHIAETSKIQGTDLWTTDVGTRIRYALGFHSQFELGTAVPSWLCGGSVDLKGGRSDFEITEVGYNALHNRLGIAMTNTGTLTNQNRPARGDLIRSMGDMDGINRARIILEAVRLASSTEVSSLQQLIAREPETLHAELVLRILLTYLPESTEPAHYIALLQQLALGAVHKPSQPSLHRVQPGKELSDAEALHQVRKIHLLPIAEERDVQAGCTDQLTLFLVHQARKIDAETGSIPEVQQLLEPFVDRDPYLRTWLISNLLPLRRLDYEYYPQNEDVYTLEAFEKLEGRPAIDALLSRSYRDGVPEKQQVARDIRGIVGPWIYGGSSRKRRKTYHDRRRNSRTAPKFPEQSTGPQEDEAVADWSEVNEWVLDLAARDFVEAADTIEQWDGPSDVDYDGYGDIEKLNDDVLRGLAKQYARTGLAAIYAVTETSHSILEGSHVVLKKLARQSDLPAPSELDDPQAPSVLDLTQAYLDQLTEVHLLHNALLRLDNPLTCPEQTSLSLTSLILSSCLLFQKLARPRSSRKLLIMALFGRREEHMEELHKTLQKVPFRTREENAWAEVRQWVLWLRDWQYQDDDKASHDRERSLGVFCKIKRVDVEIELLKAFLRASCYNLAVNVYCMSGGRPIPDDILEQVVLSVAMSFYDGASNGNRTRGGIRKASEMYSHFPDSESFEEANALLAATHSMSFYSLTLQHGVPFQPVNIRATKDPLSLIGKVLEQNPRSYTKLDDLIDIGQNLIRARHGLVPRRDLPSSKETGQAASTHTLDQQLSDSSRRITSMAIEAALSENDFDTAYSYIINRLSPTLPSSQTDTSAPPPNSKTTSEDDISWRAAYLAGRFSPSKTTLTLHRLEQRLELLSLSLLLAPSSNLPEILNVWRAAEADLIALLAREAAEEDQWNRRGDQHKSALPGDFAPSAAELNKELDRAANQRPRRLSRATANAANEEAPMGLFDVARGAAKAFSKNAFPLKAGAATTTSSTGEGKAKERPLSMASDSGSEKGERVRKRDLVANAVTGGLASGIGWVIGAPPQGKS